MSPTELTLGGGGGGGPAPDVYGTFAGTERVALDSDGLGLCKDIDFAQPFTFEAEFWFSLPVTPDAFVFAVNDANVDRFFAGFAQTANDTNLRFAITKRDTVSTSLSWDAIAVPDSWNTLICTWDGAAWSSATLNGSGSNGASGTTLSTHSRAFIGAGAQAPVWGPWYGRIRNVKFTQGDYWQWLIDEGSGSTCNDSGTKTTKRDGPIEGDLGVFWGG